MSIIITIKDNKIYPNSNFKECNICLQNNKSKKQKCTECEFCICNSCLIKWYKHNNRCPHCKKILTYKEPITNIKKCKKCYKRIRKIIVNIINIINQIIERISNTIISIIFDEKVLYRLSKITICFGTSLLYIMFGSLYILMYGCALAIVILIVIFLYHCCCCCCCNHNSYCCYLVYV